MTTPVDCTEKHWQRHNRETSIEESAFAVCLHGFQTVVKTWEIHENSSFCKKDFLGVFSKNNLLKMLQNVHVGDVKTSVVLLMCLNGNHDDRTGLTFEWNSNALSALLVHISLEPFGFQTVWTTLLKVSGSIIVSGWDHLWLANLHCLAGLIRDTRVSVSQTYGKQIKRTIFFVPTFVNCVFLLSSRWENLFKDDVFCGAFFTVHISPTPCCEREKLQCFQKTVLSTAIYWAEASSFFCRFLNLH